MAELTGSEILAKALKKEGTENLLFIMGGPMQEVLVRTTRTDIRGIDVRHEQAAAHRHVVHDAQADGVLRLPQIVVRQPRDDEQRHEV